MSRHSSLTFWRPPKLRSATCRAFCRLSPCLTYFSVSSSTWNCNSRSSSRSTLPLLTRDRIKSISVLKKRPSRYRGIVPGESHHRRSLLRLVDNRQEPNIARVTIVLQGPDQLDVGDRSSEPAWGSAAHRGCPPNSHN